MSAATPTMTAIKYHEPWRMTVERIERPVPAKGEVEIRIEVVGICGSDVHGFTGQSGRRPHGMIMGHEACGIISAVGPGVSESRIGERVALFNIISDDPPSPDEGDSSFLQKRAVGVNLFRRGAMAEYLTVPSEVAFRVPDGVPPEVAVLTEPVAVVLHGWDRIAAAGAAAERIAIIGTGTIGLGAVIAARSRGLEKIAVLDFIPEKAERARALGGIPVVVANGETPEAVSARVDQALGGKPDLVLDAAGTAGSFKQAIALVRNAGCILLIGNLEKQVTLPLQDVVSHELTFVGTYAFSREAFAASVAALPKMADVLSSFIEARCKLTDVPDVMTKLAKGEMRPLKAIIEVS